MISRRSCLIVGVRSRDMQGVFGDLGAAIQEKWQAVVDWLGLRRLRSLTSSQEFLMRSAVSLARLVSGFRRSGRHWSIGWD